MSLFLFASFFFWRTARRVRHLLDVLQQPGAGAAGAAVAVRLGRALQPLLRGLPDAAPHDPPAAAGLPPLARPEDLQVPAPAGRTPQAHARQYLLLFFFSSNIFLASSHSIFFLP